MKNNNDNDESLVISYLTLRKIVGILGTTFPFILFVGALVVFGEGIQSSISSYYHTDMGDVFVGTLCVIGFFLLSYRGYERKDDIAGDLACLFAIGVALFPTAPDGVISETAKIVGYLHLAFAAAFFATLIYFSIKLFTLQKEGVAPTMRKKNRNTVYRICGVVMAICMVLILIISLVPGLKDSLKDYAPVFWLEGIAVVFFGISWLTKGEVILKDLPGE